MLWVFFSDLLDDIPRVVITAIINENYFPSARVFFGLFADPAVKFDYGLVFVFKWDNEA